MAGGDEWEPIVDPAAPAQPKKRKAKSDQGTPARKRGPASEGGRELL